MKVLITEKIAEAGIEKLKAEGFKVDVSLGLNGEELKEKIPPYEALIVRSGTKVTADIIEKAENLKIIGRAGIGVDNIDVEAATRKGIIVANAPQSNIISAAEHTIALLLALARNIPQANASLKSCRWERSKFEGVEINGKTLGILGFGRVGFLVAQRAVGLGMRVIAYDPYVPRERFEQAGIERKEKLEDFLKEADFISLHLPKTKETLGILGDREFEIMKDGVRIVNTARGGLFKEETLVKYLKSGKVAGAAIDVFEEEPCTQSPLFEFDNVIVTPHLGASTFEAQDKAGVMIADQIIAGLKGGFVSTAVNIPSIPPEVMEAVRPYLDLCENLGKFFSFLLEEQPSLISIDYAGEVSSLETKPLTLAILKGLFEAVVEEPVTYVNALHLAKDRGVEIRESKTPTSQEYLNLITIRVPKTNLSLSGTILGRNNQPRIVKIYTYDVDLVPSKYMLVIHNVDRPGMIGALGTLLGEKGINIASMQFGREKPGGNAVSILALDSPIDTGVLKEIEGINGVSKAIPIQL